MQISSVAFVVGIIIDLIFAIICAVVASSKNRSAAGWFFGGLFLSIIGLIIVACLSPLDQRQ